MNDHNELDNNYLLIRRSHMESGLHGVNVGGGSGMSVGSTGGFWHSG